MAREFHCEVYAFDPTVPEDRFKNRSDGVSFHKLGLQGEGTDMSKTNSADYDKINPDLLLPLDDIMELLGHKNRTIDILKLDCEGCEWGVLRQLACSEDKTPINQLVVEMHFQKNLGLYNEADVMIAADSVNCLRHDGWGMVSMEASGCGGNDLEFTTGMVEIMPSPFLLLYATFQKKQSMHQLLEILNKTSDDKWHNQFKIVKQQYFEERSSKYDQHSHYDNKE